MKATGMVRRMDDLGRVVIPKEIRRTMHLREGEELEIFAEDEGLFLKKYSALSTLERCADEYAEVAQNLLGDVVYVADTHNLCAGAGAGVAQSIGAPLSQAVVAAMAGRKPTVLTHVVFGVGGTVYPYGLVFPLVVRGDLFGAMLLGASHAIGNLEQGVIQTACLLLQRQLGE